MKNLNVNDINKTLFLSIITVLLFILAMFGITYAFFNVVVSGNEKASSMIVNVVDLGTVTFLDGDEIDARNIYPMEEEERISKTFTIESVGNTAVIDYTIYLTVTANTFIYQYENEFTYTISGSSNNDGIVVSDISDSVPREGKHNIGSGVLNSGGDLHTYVFTIGLNEMDSNQNYNQNKSFAGKLSVETKKYTTGGSVYED